MLLHAAAILDCTPGVTEFPPHFRAEVLTSGSVYGAVASLEL